MRRDSVAPSASNPALHHPSQVGAVEKALACDPRSARLSAESVVARAEQKSAKAALLPQLIGQLSSNEVLGERVGLALRAQTGNGLSQAAAAQGAGERAQASEQAIVSAQRELREALRLDFVNNSAARQRIGSAATAARCKSPICWRCCKQRYLERIRNLYVVQKDFFLGL